MFKIDIFGNSEPLSLYVCKPDGTILGCIDKEIDENSVSLSMGINEEYELEFDIIKSDNSDSKWFDYLDGGMYLLLEKIGIFKINQPPITLDGVKSQKKISASGCDIELEDKTVTLELNMGTKTSQEYLVKYEDGETENLVNPYTGLPYDWLVLYNYFPEQLALFKTFVTGGNELGHSTRNVVDSSRIERFMSMVKLIPRLLNKIDYDENTGEYSLTEYMVITYANDGETVINIQYRGDDLVDRIDELITFYTKYRHQLSLLSLVLEETGGDWTVGDIYGVSENDFTLANKKFQYSADETTRSFLKQTLAKDTNCIVSLDIKNRTVNMTPVEEIGSDTGIVMSYDKLVNSMNITSNDERFTTRLYVTGKDDLGIRQVNFGLPYIDDISYYLNALDENGNRKYVSDALAAKYEAYQTELETARANYIAKTLAYNKVLKEIDELKYRVPLDDLSTDWGTFRQDELEETLKNYRNLLTALIALYKEDYGIAGVNNDGTVNEPFLKTTEYNYDYFAYQGIIKEIECALATFPYYSNQEKWTSAQLTEYKDSIAAWETNWSLYGTVELQAKIKTFSQNMDVLADSSVVRYSASSDYYDSTNQRLKSWNELTSSQKATFNNIASNSGITGDTGETAYYYAIKPYNSLTTDEQHKLETPDDYFYDEYMKHYRNYVSANAALTPMNTTLTQLETNRDTYLSQRATIADGVKLENNFTASEIKLLHRLFRDSDYSNENILITSISDENEKIEKMQELLEDGKEKLSIYSRPQLKFEVDAENIFGLPEYEKLWSQLVAGNFILVQYVDNIYIRLRLIGFTFNPSLPSSKNLSIRFSNYLLSKSEYSDIESLFGESMGSSGRGGSSGSSSGDGDYGKSDDIDITISNTMLAKLLSTEQFGTRVTNIILDTLDVNKLTARSAKFQGLANGSTLIDGGCIQTGMIKSNNYGSLSNANNPISNAIGSVLMLNDGTFNFGGGRLKWDGSSLTISGAVTASSLTLGDGVTISTNNISGLSSVATSGSYSDLSNTPSIPTNVTELTGGTNILYSTDVDVSEPTIANGLTKRTITIGSETFTEIENGDFVYTNIGIGSDQSNSDYVRISKTGLLKARNAEIYGTIYASDGSFSGAVTASSGQIGHWSIDTDGKYLKGTTLDGVQYICSLTNKRIRYNNGDYQDKFGFLVHNDTTRTFFYYDVRQVNIDGNNAFMLMEEAINQEISATSGAVNTMRAYRGTYQGAEILIGKVLTTNHSTNFPVDSYWVVETQAGVNTLKGQVRPFAEAIDTESIRIAIMNSLSMFDDDLGASGNFNSPLYETAESSDGYTVSIPNKGTNVLLSYQIESAVSGYTYLASQTLGKTVSPIIAVDVKLSSGAPNFSTAKTILYSDGSIKTNNINVNYIDSQNVYAQNVDADSLRLYLKGSDGFDDNYHTVVTSASAGTLNNQNYDKGVYFGIPNEYCSTYIRGKDVHIYPSGAVYLGKAGSTAVNSDEQLKNLSSITNKYESFFDNLSPTLYKYKQGGHRFHIGFGARAVEQALLNANLTTEEFAGVVIENNKIIPAEVSYSGEDEYYEKLYSLRYEEFIALNTHMIQKLMQRVNTLEAQVAALQE